VAKPERSGAEHRDRTSEPIAARHADLVGALPLHHRDPFDRLLVAQAMLEGLALVSDDEALRRYKVEIVW